MRVAQDRNANAAHELRALAERESLALHVLTNDKLSEPVNDTSLTKIVGRHLHPDKITHGQADKPFSHLARDVGEYDMLIGKLNFEHCSREHSDNLSLSSD
jgi:hypothetical protein